MHGAGSSIYDSVFGLRIEDVGVRDYGLWCMVYGLWFMFQVSGCMVYGLWFMVHGLWFGL